MIEPQEWFCVNCATAGDSDASGKTSLDSSGHCSKCGSDAVLSIATVVKSLHNDKPPIAEATIESIPPRLSSKRVLSQRDKENLTVLFHLTNEELLKARKQSYNIEQVMLSLSPELYQWWDGFGLAYYFGLENILEQDAVLTFEFENEDGNTKLLKLKASFVQVIDNAKVIVSQAENKG